MAEMVLPGVYIEVRPEGLIVAGQIGVGTIGIVGTASRGELWRPQVLGSLRAAQERFGYPDAWIDGNSDELTLMRALDLAYRHGASSVVAVRISARDNNNNDVAAPASRTLASAGGNCVTLRANSAGAWGEDLQVNVAAAAADPFIENEEHAGSEAPPITLGRTPVVKSARTRIRHFVDATGVTNSLAVLYDDDAASPGADEVKIDRASGALTFGAAPAAADTVTASYLVSRASAVQVTVRQMRGTTVEAQEIYTIVDGDDLVADVTAGPSSLVDAVAEANSGETPSLSSPPTTFAAFAGGENGEAAGSGDYRAGLDRLLNEDAHIMLAAGQPDSFGDDLDAHCQAASTDAVRRDRIGVTGSAVGATLDTIRGHTLNSDRIVFVAPGVVVDEVTLPGAYAAAAVAGLLAGFDPETSLTNKPLRVDGVERRFDSAELGQLLRSRVLALELRQGIKVVRGITTSTNTAWTQITTRRIVDYAKYGVRSASEPFIGLLNNERVRAALNVTVNDFLTRMVEDEMLVGYSLTVSATRAEERAGIARVTMTLQPTFSIDFIVVTMFLE